MVPVLVPARTSWLSAGLTASAKSGEPGFSGSGARGAQVLGGGASARAGLANARGRHASAVAARRWKNRDTCPRIMAQEAPEGQFWGCARLPPPEIPSPGRIESLRAG